MREVQITDAELERLIAPAIRKFMRRVGFKMGTPSDETPSAFMFPINLNLSGAIGVHRSEDGVWTFSQEDDPMLADRMIETMIAHGQAFDTRATPSRAE